MILTVTLNAALDKRYVVEKLTPQTVMRVKQVDITAGGKGLNVSRIAALGGEAVTAMGLTGGSSGALLESLITQPSITKAFTRISAPTRTCVNVWDEATRKSTEFLEPGSFVTQDDASFFVKEYEARLPLADVIVLSGSLPQGIDASFYCLLTELAKKHKKPVIIDTSGEALQSSIKARPTLIKPNSDELKQILNVDINSRAELICAANRLYEEGIEFVAVSLGRDGVLLVCKQGVFQGITPDIAVVNTVGCGDSMVAGFAVGMARGMNIQDTVHYAVSVSTANAINPKTGWYEKSDLDYIKPLVKVIQLE